MTPETAAMRPPRKGPMLRQTSPERRSGLMGAAAPSVSSAARQRMVRVLERGEERRVDMAKSLEVKREDMPIGRQAGRSLSDPYNHASGTRPGTITRGRARAEPPATVIHEPPPDRGPPGAAGPLPASRSAMR